VVLASRVCTSDLLLEANTNQRDLVSLKDLLEAGKVEPVIDRRYALSDAAEDNWDQFFYKEKMVRIGLGRVLGQWRARNAL
jgi:hypothetical protein